MTLEPLRRVRGNLSEENLQGVNKNIRYDYNKATWGQEFPPNQSNKGLTNITLFSIELTVYIIFT